MVKSLRKRHLQIWSMLMVLLPVSIVLARLATPKQALDKLLQPNAIEPYPVIVKTINQQNYTINIRKSNDTAYQLEWINKTVLTWPTATIYKIAKGSTGIKNGSLIGRIEARGTYRFNLPANQPINQSTDQLILYDFIHQQIIDTIIF